ncbi:MAG: glycosyltransferase [Oscillospiraceae bacterium]|nr:glycosyltransferase [Oscillospiraceae bacterium]
MKKLLVLFTNGYPYGSSEPFLENEVPLYKEYFDKVLIVTPCRKGDRPTRTVDDSIEVLPDYTLAKDLPSILSAIPGMLRDKMFYRELKLLFGREGFSFKKLYDLVVASLCANHRAKQALRWLKKHPEHTPQVLYSYWINIPAYSALRLRKRLKRPTLPCVTRCHGFDVYHERSSTGYLPFQQQLFEGMNQVAVISQQAKGYFQQRYGASEKMKLHRLGAWDYGIENPVTDRAPLRLVSCARVVPLKRLNRIVDALCLIKNRPIYWTHIGGGEGLAELERYAAERLGENVTVHFTGAVTNEQVYRIYMEQSFHVALNVSETEGVPVSVMETMSFHIPAIATAVGGTAELVDHGKNGFLLPKDFADETLVEYIRRFADMPDEEYRSFRRSARRKFETDYHAQTNYRRFVSRLAQMCKIPSDSL